MFLSHPGPGVYAIVNLTTGQLYIGSSVTVKTRTRVHYGELKSNKHRNKYLQAAWNKYPSFEFWLLEECDTKEESMVAEQWYLENWPKEELYNIVLNNSLPQEKAGRNSHLYQELTPERKAAFKEYRKEKHKRYIEQRKKDGLYRKKGPLLKPYQRKIPLDEINAGVAFPPLVDPEGNVHEGVNLARFCRQHNLRPKSIQKLRQGLQRSTHGGWKLLNPPPPDIEKARIKHKQNAARKKEKNRIRKQERLRLKQQAQKNP